MDLEEAEEAPGGACDLLIGCALDKEVEILRRRLGQRYQYLVTGMGRRRTESSLSGHLQSHQPSLLIFTGTAGQLDPTLEMGQVVFPEIWCLQDGPCFPADPDWVGKLRERGWDVSGRGLTVTFPVARRQVRLELHQKLAASVCDMEAAVALRAASDFGVPCLAPKVIADTAQSALVAFWTHFEANMSKLADYLGRLLPEIEAISHSSSRS